MNIIVTGGSGFLGREIVSALGTNNKLVTLGRGSTNDIVCDLSVTTPRLPDAGLVVHAAGLAHVVPTSVSEQEAFFRVNVEGTKNILKALSQNLPGTLVFISSVSVYGRESGLNIDETHPLNATDPYGRSKIEAEKLVLDWGRKNNVPVVVLRLPLIIGAHPPGNLGAMIKAIRKGYYLRIGKGKAQRSVVYARDVAMLLPHLLGRQGIFNLTDGKHPTVAEIDAAIAEKLHRRIWRIPTGLAVILAHIGDFLPRFPFNSRTWKKLTQSLTFSDALARKQLQWNSGPASFDFLKH